MKRIVYIIISFISLSCLTYSCHKTEEAETIDSTAMTLALLPTLDNLPLYYAEQTGIFDSLGLDIRLVTYNSAMDCDTAFTNGEVDGVVSDIVKANIWRSRGDSIRVVMATELNMFLTTAHAARIMALPSIKEKIIAVTRNSSVDFVSDLIMDSIKLDRLELNKPQINDIPLRCRMVNQNQFDGALLPEPYASIAEANGAHRLIASDKLTDNLSAVIFHDSIIAKRNNDISLLVKAYNIAADKLNMHIEQHDSTLLAFLPGDIIKETPDSIMSFTPFKQVSLPTRKAVAKSAEWAKGRELMKNMVDYSELIDSLFVTKQTR